MKGNFIISTVTGLTVSTVIDNLLQIWKKNYLFSNFKRLVVKHEGSQFSDLKTTCIIKKMNSYSVV